MRLLWACAITISALGFSGCLLQRTVTDGQGNMIYQEPDVVNPFSSPESEQNLARERARKQGW